MPTGADPAPESPAARSAQPLWRRPWFRWLVRVGLLLLVMGIVLIVGFDGCFYYPDREVRATPDEFGIRFEAVTFKTSDGLTLSGWFLPAEGTAVGTVIHFHGNAGNITGHFPLASWLTEDGYNVLVFDYRGYGESEGKVTRAGTIRDGHAAVDYVLSRPDVDAKRLFAFGQSLGGAVAIVVAAERPEIRAVVAESTFGSYRRIAALHARRLVVSKWLAGALAGTTVSDGFDPLDVLDRLPPRPLLVIAAGSDTICPPVLSRELFEAASEPKSYWEVPGAEHLEASFSDTREARKRITACFEQGAKLAQ